MRPFIVSVAIGAAIFLILLLAGIVYTTRGQPEPPASAASLSGRILYLSPTNRLIRPAPELESEGIRTYTDSSAFIQAVETTPGAVIMIDRDFANQLDSKWLRQQYDEGKVLIGVGVRSSRCQSRRAISASTPAARQDGRMRRISFGEGRSVKDFCPSLGIQTEPLPLTRSSLCATTASCSVRWRPASGDYR
jgi:hypothetical protein